MSDRLHNDEAESSSPFDLSLEPTDDVLPNQLIGSSGMLYRPLRQLGEGGMARIYLAHARGSSGFAKLVVLKVMRRRAAESAAREMFLAEARLCARLNHPNLVQVYEVVQSGELPYLVMEYLDGKPLSSLRQGPHISRTMLISVLCEALTGLQYAHELQDFDGTPLKIVHRDVSPHNVFVTYDGAVKVLDFGIAKTDAGSSNTRTGEIKGKLAYMAPEQLFGSKLDARADVFAMGAVLYEMVTGGRLWEDVAQPNLILRLANGDIPRPDPVAVADPELERIIVKATASDTDARYESARAFRRELEAYLVHNGGVCPARAIGQALASAFGAERDESRRATSLALQASIPPVAPPLEPTEHTLSSAPELLRPARRTRAWLYAVPLALVVAAGGLLAAQNRQNRAVQNPPVALPSPQTELPLVELDVEAKPSHAEIELDGKVIGTGNVRLEIRGDREQHRLLVKAPNHHPVTRLLTLEHSQKLELRLEPVGAPQPLPDDAPRAARERAPVPPSGQGFSRSKRQVEPRSAPQAPAETPTTAAVPANAGSCEPPYYFKDGIKTYRPECL